MMIEGGVNEIDAQDSDGFLLVRGLPIQQPHVDDDGGGIAERMRLEFDAEPALSLFLAGPGPLFGGHGVGKRKKSAFAAPGLFEAPEEQVEF